MQYGCDWNLTFHFNTSTRIAVTKLWTSDLIVRYCYADDVEMCGH